MGEPLQDLKEFLESEPLLEGVRERGESSDEDLLIHVYDMV
jgi:hypothetical protein